MRALRVLFAAVVAALSLVVVGATPSFACSCVMADAAQHVEWADVVVSGTVTDVVSLSSRRATGYVLDVDRVFKGRSGPGLEVLSEGSGASCGLENIQADRRYVFFAAHQTIDGKDSELLWASLCGGTGPATPKLLAAVEAAAGTGGTPPPAEPERTAYDSELTITFDEPTDEQPSQDDWLARWALPIGLVAGGSLVLLTAVLWVRHRVT